MAAKKTIAASIVITLIFLSTPALGFNSSRRGFCMAVGVGPSLTSSSSDASFDYTYYVLDPSTGNTLLMTHHVNPTHRSEVGVSTDFQLGYGFNERVAITYENRVSWLAIDSGFGFASGVTALLMTWYASAAPRTPYLSAGAGLGSSEVRGSSSHDTSLAWIAVAGYEWRHLAVEVAGTHFRTNEYYGTRGWTSLHLDLAWKGY